MRELQRRQRLKRALHSIPSLILLSVLTFFLAKGAYGIMKIERDSAKKVSGLEAEAAALSSREGELKDEIAYLGTEEGQVREIKEKFNVTRENEHVAIIVEAKGSTEAENTKESWWRRIWHAIMSSL